MNSTEYRSSEQNLHQFLRVSFLHNIYVQYLSVSVEMLEDTTETKDALSLTSPPGNMQLSLNFCPLQTKTLSETLSKLPSD